jgi:hypothetical protein
MFARILKAEPDSTFQDTNDHTETAKPQCHSCVHWKKGTLTCEAFPDDPPGIPDAILTNEVIHDHDVEGDHGIHYEAKA